MPGDTAYDGSNVRLPEGCLQRLLMYHSSIVRVWHNGTLQPRRQRARRVIHAIAGFSSYMCVYVRILDVVSSCQFELSRNRVRRSDLTS